MPETTKENQQSHNQRIGRLGEKLACHYLEEQGYRLLDQNWNCEYGELDIVCYDTHLQILVFVEVKTRASNYLGGARYAISRSKYARLRRLVGAWLQAQPSLETVEYKQIRLDLIAIDNVRSQKSVLTHTKGI